MRGRKNGEGKNVTFEPLPKLIDKLHNDKPVVLTQILLSINQVIYRQSPFTFQGLRHEYCDTINCLDRHVY